LRALLKLLTHLTQRDLIDFGSTEEESAAGAANGAGQAVDVAQLVFLGLDILIPLISLELLGYPKLCLLYFQLLAYMMEVSATIAHLQGQLTVVVLISRCLSVVKGRPFSTAAVSSEVCRTRRDCRWLKMVFQQYNCT